ncbi:MAG: molecular chaperone HtpG, partial [Lachnospiraceae bacterium]|nr:molecular chaperone HtpG [Lachnospiraceae bacterium]
VIDCPDLPLNVSRSALQNDGFVTKISEYITKKVADKLSGMCKTDKENYEKYWDDISPFIKFGCLKDDKFCEKMTDYILFKNLDGKYLTLPECLEVKKIDPDEAENKDENTASATDAETGEKIDAEVVDGDGDTADDTENKETKEKIIYYVTDLVQQSQYVNMFKKANMDAVVLPDKIDQPFVSQLESKNEGIKFARIDADLTDTFKTENSKEEEEELTKKSEEITEVFKKAVKNENITVKVEKLKNEDIASMITVSEESRRMQDMMKMYAMPGMDMGMMGREGETLILNANNQLVSYVLDNKEGENVELICEQLYDLALIQQSPLQPEAMTKFINRSNKIMMLLTKTEIK